VQCDTCSKWRKLAPGATPWADDKGFVCTSNTWTLSRASCDVPEDMETQAAGNNEPTVRDVRTDAFSPP
jgi:hypothetical protein